MSRAFVAIVVVGLASSTGADYRDWCGWSELVDRIGLENVPTGVDVIVGQVEAPDSNGYYLPDGDDPDFDGKYLIRRSGGSTNPSAHATGVARKYYGLTNSLAPGVWFINCYEVNKSRQSAGRGGGRSEDLESRLGPRHRKHVLRPGSASAA